MIFRRLSIIATILCSGAQALYAQNSATIMTINGLPIEKAEFEYAYHKNRSLQEQTTHKALDPKSYAQLFANYKVKVEAAKSAGIDTTADFRNEYAMYRAMQLNEVLQDSVFIDSIAREVYAQMQAEVQGKDLVRTRHIFIAVPQGASTEQAVAAKKQIDSLYMRLQSGADFAALAQQYSNDPTSAQRGGELPWFGMGQTVKEFEEVVYGLTIGYPSSPFASPMGYHIVELLERKALESYEEKRIEILSYLKQRGIEEVAAQRTIDRRITESNGELTREEILATAEKEALLKDPTLKYLLQEYHDGLLLIAISEREVWNQNTYKEADVAHYFARNKKQFRWEAPRFKGYVMHLYANSQAKTVKKWMKRYGHGDWKIAFDSTFNKDSAMVHVTEGVYRQGDNPYVDHFVYKGAEATAAARFPYIYVVGKIIKQPKIWSDDRPAVLEAYRKEKELRWVSELRQKYPVIIDERVLSEIKSH